jgi:class 3 adenylate cyclase/tetratricopeptide (TPR) repeat protein
MSGKVSKWLVDLELDQYAAVFEENDIGWELLGEIDQETLKDIGITSAGHRLRILKGIRTLNPGKAASISIDVKASLSESIKDPKIDAGNSGWSRTPGERKPVTMLFADIVGSTSLTEKLDAEDAHDLLYRATQWMCKAVENNKGTVCRFMGDGIMAMFGAPVASERHALEACCAAIEMQNSISKYAAELNNSLGLGVQIRVGLHSGEVVVLEVGDDADNPEYDASGPTVPLAARMEQSAAAGTVLMTASTRALAGSFIETDEHAAVTVKGISEPVVVHQLSKILSAADSSIRGTRHPFVGRKVELAQFRSLLDSCLDTGHGQIVYVRGEAGIGKSRLVEEITILAQKYGLQPHKALVLDFGAGKGQEAVPTLMRSFLGITAGSGKEQREAALKQAEKNGIADPEQRVYLNDLLDLTQPLELRTLYDAMNAEVRSEGKRAAMLNVLTQLAAHERLLVVIEDLHWADEVTLEYLAGLAVAVAECPVLMVMTSRAEGDPIDATWRARAADSPVLTWDLGPLRKEESVSLVASFIDASDDIAKRCIERAAGNPLFLEQLLLNVATGSTESVPDSIKSLVLTRVDRLTEEDKQALQAAAVLGQRFDLEGLRFLIDKADYECGELIEHHLVRPEGSLYLFAHALIQEGAYASLLKRHRLELHRSAAAWFDGEDPILFAEHLDYAADDKAARAYLLAAQQQSDQYRPNRALQLVRRGLEIAADMDRFSLKCLEGKLLQTLGSVSESIAAFTTANKLAGDDVERCRALLGLAEGLNITGAHDELMETLHSAEDLANSNAMTYELARIFQLRGGVFFFKSESDACLQTNLASLKLAREVSSPEIEARALSGLGDAEYARGHYLSASKHFEQCIKLAREHGLGRIIAANLPMLGIVSIWQNKFELTAATYHEASELAVNTQDLRAELLNLISGAIYWVTLDDLEQAEDCLQRGQTIARRLGSNIFEGVCFQYLGRILFIKGDNLKACKFAQQAVDVLRKSESGMTFRGPGALGVLALTTDDKTTRLAAMQEAEALLAAGSVSHSHLNFYEDAMEACLRAGEWDEVNRFALALEDYTKDEPMPRCEFYIAWGRALAAHGHGNRDQACMAELQGLHDQAREIGLALSLPALETALASP